MSQKEDKDPNLGVLVDQTVEQIFWDRTENKKVKALMIIFKEHTLAIEHTPDHLIVKLVEQ